MTLWTQIAQDLTQAMRDKDVVRRDVLRMLKAELKNVAIEKFGADGTLEDPDAFAVIRKEVKRRQDAIDGFEKGGRPELAEKERIEMAVLNSYLPKPLSESELQKLVDDAINETGATSKAQMGQVIKSVQEKAAGRADGKTISQLVQARLNQ